MGAELVRRRDFGGEPAYRPCSDLRRGGVRVRNHAGAAACRR